MSETLTRTRSERLLFIDNLRWSAISMVVVMHAAVTYSPFGSWYFRDGSATGRTAVICLGTYQSFQHAVSMGLLFGIAGYFARAALERKGTGGFLRERAYRLGLPLLLYMLVVGPATQYFVAGSWHSTPPRTFATEWLRHIADGEVFSESGPLWFCLVLMTFSLCFAGLRLVLPRLRGGAERAVPGPVAVLSFAVAMAALTFVVGIVLPRDRTVLNVDLHDLPQYPLMFAAGVLAQRSNWPMRFSSRAGRIWLWSGVAVAAVAWFLLISQGGALQGHLRAYGGGWHWQAAGMDLWRSFTCVALSLGLITLYRDRFNRQGPVSRFLARNAFGVYVFHPPILIAATRVLHYWPADAAIKFFVASIIGVTLTFLFVGLVARRTPGLRAII